LELSDRRQAEVELKLESRAVFVMVEVEQELGHLGRCESGEQLLSSATTFPLLAELKAHSSHWAAQRRCARSTRLCLAGAFPRSSVHWKAASLAFGDEASSARPSQAQSDALSEHLVLLELTYTSFVPEKIACSLVSKVQEQPERVRAWALKIELALSLLALLQFCWCGRCV